MSARTLGNPRVKESKGARQARLLRALEHRVRRLEKQAWPAVTNDAKPLLQFDVARLKLGPAVLGPLHRAAQDAFNHETTLRALHPFHPSDLCDCTACRDERAHRWPDAVLREMSNRPEVPAPQPWWMRLHRFSVDLSRRALGVSAPSCGERGAGPSLSDDTQ